MAKPLSLNPSKCDTTWRELLVKLIEFMNGTDLDEPVCIYDYTKDQYVQLQNMELRTEGEAGGPELHLVVESEWKKDILGKQVIEFTKNGEANYKKGAKIHYIKGVRVKVEILKDNGGSVDVQYRNSKVKTTLPKSDFRLL